MSAHTQQPKNEHRQPLSAVELDELITSLQENKSPKQLSGDIQSQAAMRLHALTSDHTIDTQFALNLKQDILQSVRAGSTEIVKREKRRDIWKMLLLPIAPLGVTAAAVVVAIQLNQGAADATPVAEAGSAEPARLVGAPVIDEEVQRPEGGYTIDYVEFQRRLNERSSSGDLVDLGYGNLPSRGPKAVAESPNSDDDVGEEKNNLNLYTELRNDAYSTLASDVEITELLRRGGLDVTRVEEFMEEYEKTIESWPTDDDPFDEDDYEKAVNDYVQHNKGWNRLMNEITDELVRDYQERNPQWQPGQPIVE